MKDDTKRKLLSIFILFIFIIVVVSAVNYLFSKFIVVVGPKVNPNAYQTVFLEGNQQYFGHLKGLGTRAPYMTDVYYVRPIGQYKPDLLQQNFSLVKMGDEINGPENKLYLNWDKVLMWQEMKADSKITKAIEQDKLRRTGK